MKRIEKEGWVCDITGRGIAFIVKLPLFYIGIQ